MNSISQKRLNEIILKFAKIDPIAVVGDIGIDKYTLGQVNRVSPEAPVPIVEVVKEWEKLGLAANVSDNLNSLGVKTTLCGVVGEDRNASRMKILLEDKQMPLDGLIEDKTRRTIFKERITTDIQQICRVDYESTALISDSIERELNQRVESFSQSHSSLIIEDYSKGTLTKAVIENAINHFSNAGKMVFVDPGRNTNPEFYKGVDLLKPNRIEAATMVESLGYKSQDTELAKQAEILMDVLDLKYLVITLGKDGVALLNRDEGKLKIIPTLAKEVFDVSGAGDTTIALLAASLSTGATLEESAWISNCGAGIVVGKSGTATLTTDELTLKSSNL